MRTWSDWPLGRTIALGDVPRGTVIAKDRGESSIVYEIDGLPGWLAKLYRPGFPKEPISVLDRIIALPEGVRPDELVLVDSTVAWPVSRIVDGSRTAGVVVAKAPEEFFADFRTVSGRPNRKLVELDHLAQPDERFEQLGFQIPTTAQRLAAVRQLVAVGKLFERYDVVYGDWSYANAFWSPTNGKIFVIDVDACGIGHRKFVESNSWSDPIVDRGTPLDTYTDRYKLAVLVLRCLTGVRGNPTDALKAFRSFQYDSHLEARLEAGVTAFHLTLRPSAEELLNAVEQAIKALKTPAHRITVGRPGAVTTAPASGVVGWTAVGNLRGSVQPQTSNSTARVGKPPSRPTTARPADSRPGSSPPPQPWGGHQHARAPDRRKERDAVGSILIMGAIFIGFLVLIRLFNLLGAVLR